MFLAGARASGGGSWTVQRNGRSVRVGFGPGILISPALKGLIRVRLFPER
jgi:hypothetical protein